MPGVPQQTWVDEATERGFAWAVTIPAATTVMAGITTGQYAVALQERQALSSGADTTIALYEDIPYSAGVAAVLLNRNRMMQGRADLNPSSDVKTSVTASPAGTPITGFRLIGGNKPAVIAGDGVGGGSTIILKPETSHVLILQNSDVTSADVQLIAILRTCRTGS